MRAAREFDDTEAAAAEAKKKAAEGAADATQTTT